MACQVKSFAPVRHNKWPVKAPNGFTSTHVFTRVAAIIAHKKQVVYERYNWLYGLIQKKMLAYIFQPQSISLIEINNYKEEK